MFKIEKNIKIPPYSKGNRGIGHLENSLISKMINTIKKMKIGDSFIIKDSQYKTLNKIFNYYNEFPDKKFTTRRIDNMRRVFRTK